MYHRSEGYFEGFDGSHLFYQKWSAHKPRATLIITHGQAEHSGCYQRLIQFIKDHMPEMQFEIYAWDLRGHGRSDGLRGYADDFNDYVKDYTIFLKHLGLEKSTRPLYLFGHSMGGLIQFRALCNEHAFPVTAQILSAPMFGISVQIPPYKEKAASLVRLLAPKLTLGNEISFEDLTRDIDVLREYEQDTLRHDRIAAGVFLGSQNAMSECRIMAPRVKIPTLLVMSEHDPVTNTPAALDILERMESPNTKSFLVADGKHELINDIDRESVFQEIKKFLLQAPAEKHTAAEHP